MKKLTFFFFFPFFILFFTLPAFAITYYTAKTGSDSNSCVQAQNTATPKLTIASGMGCLAGGGDTLYIRTGVYAETIIFGSTSTLKGSLWANPLTIASYPAETAIVRPTSGYAAVRVISNTTEYVVFDRLEIDATNMTNQGVRLEGSRGRIRISNCNIYGSPDNNILIVNASGSNEIIGNDIHHNIETEGVGEPYGHGIYIESSSNLIERNVIHHNTGYGVHVYNGSGTRANNNIIRYNIGHNNATSSFAPGSAAFLIGSGDNNVLHNNIAYGQPVGFMAGFNASTNGKIYNNVAYNNSRDGIQIRSSSTSVVIKNNILQDNNTSAGGYANINNFSSSGTTFSNNRCFSTGGTSNCSSTTDPLFVNAAANNFALQASSPAINAGVAIAGYPYNGAAPDQGAHETFTCTSVLPDTAGDNTIVITCENNLAPPLLPATGCLGFSAKKNDVNNAITDCSRTADNKITLTLTNSYINTDVGKWSYVTASGNVTDSMKIGGTLNQRLNAVTDQIPTNQIGISAPVLTQVSGRFSVGGTEAAADRKLQNNVELAVPPQACFNYRVCISNTIASFGVSGYTLRAQKNGAGGYLAISNGPTPTTGISFIANTGRISYLLPGPTTEQLACPDTFVPGGVMLSASEVPNITLATGEGTELIYGLCVGESNADNDFFDLRVYSAGGVPLNTYTQTGRVRVRTSAAFSTQIGAP